LNDVLPDLTKYNLINNQYFFIRPKVKPWYL